MMMHASREHARQPGRGTAVEHGPAAPGRRTLTEESSAQGARPGAPAAPGRRTLTQGVSAQGAGGDHRDPAVEPDAVATASTEGETVAPGGGDGAAALADGCRAADESLDGMVARFGTIRDAWLDPGNHDTRAEIDAAAADLRARLEEAQARFGAVLEACAPAEREAGIAYAEQWTREFATKISLLELMPERRGSRQTRLFGEGDNRERAHLEHVLEQARAVSRVLCEMQHADGLVPPVGLARSLEGAAQLALQVVLEHRPIRTFFRTDAPWAAMYRALPEEVSAWSGLLSAHDQVAGTVEARDGVAHELAGGDAALADDFAALADVVHRGVQANLGEGDPIYDPVRALLGRPAADRQAFLRTLDRRGDYDAFGTYAGGLYLALREGTSFAADPVHDARGLDAVAEGVAQYGEEFAAQWDRVRAAIANLAENGGHLICGALEGMAATGVGDPALLAALDAMTAGLSAILLPPVVLAGMGVGLGEALADAVAQLAEILADPEGFAEQLLDFADIMCSDEGAELAAALGYDLGHGMCETLVGWSEMGAPELAWNVGRLAGGVLFEIVLNAIGAGLTARVARFARASRLLGPRFAPGGPNAPARRDAPALRDAPAHTASIAGAGESKADVLADVGALERRGRITASDYALVYSTDDPVRARQILSERLASHHDATVPGADYTGEAAARERAGDAPAGTAADVAAADDDWQRQVILDGEQDRSLRTQVHASHEAARADYDQRVAADPMRELALVEIREEYRRGDGAWAVVEGEHRMVPIDHRRCRIFAHNHPPGADGTYTALQAMPSIVDGDVMVALEESLRAGRQVAQEITLSFPDGQRTVPLVADAPNATLWFDVPTPEGDSIGVRFEGGRWQIRRGDFAADARDPQAVMRWMTALWDYRPGAQP